MIRWRVLAISFLAVVASPGIHHARAESPPASGGRTLDFTEDQRAELRLLGCRFDEVDRAVAARLQARGFTAEHFIRAYQDLRAAGSTDRQKIEELVVLRYMGVPASEFKQFLSYEMTPSSYFNWRQGGRGLAIVGWILVGLAAGAAVGGGVLLGQGYSDVPKCSLSTQGSVAYKQCKALVEDKEGQQSGGILLSSAAFIMGAVGLPMGIVGTTRWRRWVPDKLLEEGRLEDLYKHRVASGPSRHARSGRGPTESQHSAGADWLVSSYFSGSGVGLKLTLRF